MKNLQIPLDSSKTLIKNPTHYYIGSIDWVDCYNFIDTMIFLKLIREGHSAYYIIKSKTDNKEYPLFISEMLNIVQSAKIMSGEVTGEWTFRKQGNDYSLKFIK